MSLTLFIIASLAQSCGPKNHSSFKNEMVMSAFYDSNNLSTLDMELLEDLPRVVNLKKDMTIVKNQDTRGTCTFFSIIAALEASFKKDFLIDVNLSEEFLIYQTKNAGNSPNEDSSFFLDNLKALKEFGIVKESDWPYQPSWFANGLPCSQFKNTDTDAPLKCFSHNRPTDEVMNKVISAEKFVTQTIPSDTNELIKFLAKERRPVIANLIVNENGWSKSGDVFYNDVLRKECLKSPSSCGVHSVLLTGYDLNKKIFYFKNSYGEVWGDQGYGTVTFDTVDRFGPGQYYSIKANSKPNILKDRLEKINLKDFSVISKLRPDKSLSIKAIGEVQGADGHLISVSSNFVKQPLILYENLSDENIQSIPFSLENSLNFNQKWVASNHYFTAESHGDNLVWDTNAPINLDIPSKVMKTAEVTKVLNSKSEKSFLRTTIYYFTDTGYKILKRIYHSIDLK